MEQLAGLGKMDRERLAANVIEKDYVLGWLLAGITAHPELGLAWVFKGGTCLKKGYFETYRFSRGFVAGKGTSEGTCLCVNARRQAAAFMNSSG